MLATTFKTTEDKIITALLASPGTTAKQTHQVLAGQEKISLQAVYDAIRKLVNGGAVVKQGTKLFVTQEWLLKLQQMLPAQAAFQVEQGESVRWVFNNLSHLDAFWKHVFFQILQDYPGQPVFMSGPHAFWPYAPERSQSEQDFYAYFNNNKLHTYYAVPGQSQADIYMASKLKSEYVHLEPTKLSQDPLGHYVVVGDIVSTTKLRRQDEEKINALYKKDLPRSSFVPAITELLGNINRATFTVEHNHEKAKKLRKAIAKDFYVPRDLVEKYDLW